MRRLLSLLLLLLLLLLPFLLHATSAVNGGVRCDRQCGSTTVPYPLGFSGDCPITLTCNQTSSAASLLLPHSAGTAASPYTILSFNASASTFLVSLPTSCNRTVGEARAALNGSGYGVTNHTGLFLRGSCRSHSAAANCSVSASVMATVLRTAGCGDNGTTAWTCVAQLPLSSGSSPNSSSSTTAAAAPAARGGEDGQSSSSSSFLPWKKVDDAGCEDALTSVVYTFTPEGLLSVELAAAELGWWLNGACAGNATCAQNATCYDVETPTGGSGHRCACVDGMSGDGYAAGDGCHFGGAGSSKKKVFLIAAGVLAGVAAAAGLLLLWRRRCRRYKAGRSASERLAAMRLLSEAAASSGVPVYSFAEIARATNSFSHTHRLGTGAYGTVYVGKLPGSSSAPAAALVAIKRLRCRLHHDDDDAAAEAALLLNEIKLISAVSHPNLVRLLGCCLDRGEQVLVYEYVPNGTLSQHLVSSSSGGGGGVRSRLTWRARLGVAAETAAAIAYLHGMRPPIFHRDVKSSNILLDGALRPKLADFGLSRAVDRLEAARSHVSTAPQGTPGYVDPEYHQNFHLSDKSDVYSFGVVLLELITAMKVVDFDRPPAEVNLASLALDRIGKGRVSEIVDPALLAGDEDWVMGSVRLVSELAFRCLAFQKDVRPSMSEVAAELHRIRLAAPDVDGDSESEEPGSRLRPVNMMDIQIDVSLDGPDAVAKKAAASPVSVQEVWVSDHSSPSTNGSMPRFAA
ncbi:wall-associated receptor kinase-like 14 isoform X2 [Sorghum bicolor]|uniref:wall-associated receptor kinase-like 14 isoform X2 n=1 Tax=Sorghum bicolor TaxID=4558 RepID=UPI000B424FF3|nr:wall-associated receptor kinase-like 14 isoform X2 [Sorghum bicolor]|eukprot:XP_021301874.1 wall-associated receptor kinase-like 14 isoform X2 [Sorghum bicolor]